MNIDEMKAGPEFDALLATEVMGWTKILQADGVLRQEGGSDLVEVWTWPPRVRLEPGAFNVAGVAVDDWSPSTDMRAAFEVLEEIRSRFSVSIQARSDRPQNGWSVCIGEAMSEDVPLPLAICRAALKAVMG